MPSSPLKIFVAYDPADTELKSDLLQHLTPLVRQQVITIWSQDLIKAGLQIGSETTTHLEQADLVLLLLSANYLASDQYDTVVLPALQRHATGKTRVIPILLRHIDLTLTPFAEFKVLPSNKQPVTEWQQGDKAFVDIQQGIQKVIKDLNGPSPSADQRLMQGDISHQQALEREARLRDKYTNQREFVQDRLDRFVGRQVELAALQECIAGKRQHGGYVIITGDAGQGKSSIIAKMIAAQGIDTSAYHFIQSGSGPNYQVSILRNLMARLILKYDLPEHYVTGESYPILRDYFVRVLNDIAEKREQEIIYVDGLDQLEMDSSAPLDLSFLPTSLPSGIVIVIGTRPNDTLKPMKRLIGSDNPYALPGLSREDFELMLRRYRASLPTALGDRLYAKLNSNALYLGLVAQELVEHHGLQIEALIAKVESNPNNIFTITFSRMEQLPEWYDAIRPILGVLLVAQEPLTSQQIAHISGKENVRIRDGIVRLGGLLTRADQQKHTLFHLKLSEYLRQDIHNPDKEFQFDVEEEEVLHGQVASWCGQGEIGQLWLKIPGPSSHDDYQEYAQKHYITHLYHARRDEPLFETLNTGDYERGKLRFDPSTRSTAIDLMLGARTAARTAITLAEGKKLLPHLWRYTLLRTSLTTRADAYPIEAFQALLALGRDREALDLAELLTQPVRRLAVLILVAEYLLKQPEREVEGRQIYSNAYEIATAIEDSNTQAKALRELTEILINMGKLTRAEEVARSIKMNEERVNALSNLATKLKLANEEEKAETLWQEANTTASAIVDNDQLSRAIYHLSVSFLRAKEWERAETAARSINVNEEKISALCQLALSFTQEGLDLQAEAVWEEVQTVLNAITETEEQDKAHRIYAITQAQFGLHDKAEVIARRKITNPSEKMAVLGSLASNHVSEGLWEDCKRIIDLIVKEYDLIDVAPSALDNILVGISIDLARGDQWVQASETAFAIPRKEAQGRALMGIVSALAQAGLSEKAQEVWEEARDMCIAQTDEVQADVTRILVSVLVEVGQIEQAKQIILTLPDKQMQEYIREEVAIALARVGQIAEAENVASETTNPQRKTNIQHSIAIAQMKAGQSTQALATAHSIPQGEKQSRALADLVTICCQMHQWDTAKTIAHQIQSNPLQADALGHIAVALVYDGHLPTALTLVRSIDNEYFKANAWSDLINAFAKNGGSRDRAYQYIRNIRNNRIYKKTECNILIAIGQPRFAASIAREIDAGSEQNEALYNVAVAYAHSQSWAEAEKIIQEIGDDKREEAWEALAIEFAQAKQWKQAITALDKIQKSKLRIAVLQAWGKLLIQPASDETREQIVQHLDKSKEKASLLVSISNSLAEDGRYLDQIRLIQQAWLQASTKNDCQYLFAMVQGLLLYQPEMCNGFYESFEWMDKFLNA